MVKKLCDGMPNLVFPADELEGLSYYEILCKIHAKLNEVINQLNENESNIGAFTQDMTGKYNRLFKAWEDTKKWIDSYFDNLDVQEEINNKLEDMIQSGELENIINIYFKSVVIYDTVNDMKLSDIKIGQYVKTGGYYQRNDGGSALYYCRQRQTSDEENGFFILSNNKTFVLIHNYNINVLSLGLKKDFFIFNEENEPYYELYPDNQTVNPQYTDNTSLLNSAMLYLTTKGGGTLFFPPGYYGFKSSIYLQQCVSIKGDSYSATYLATNDNIGDFIIGNIGGGIFLDNFAVLYNNENQGNGINIKNSGGSYPIYAKTSVSNIHILNAGMNGIQNTIGANADFYNLKFTRCKNYGLYHTGSDTTYVKVNCWECVAGGIYLSGGNNKIDNCKIYYCGNYNIPQSISDIVGNYSVVIAGSRNLIANIDLQDNYKNGLYIGGADAVINGGVIDACGVTALQQNYVETKFNSYAVVVHGVGPICSNIHVTNYLFNVSSDYVQNKFCLIDEITYGLCYFNVFKSGYSNHVNGNLEFSDESLKSRIYGYHNRIDIAAPYIFITNAVNLTPAESKIIVPSNYLGTYFSVNNGNIVVNYTKHYTLSISMLINAVSSFDRGYISIRKNSSEVYRAIITANTEVTLHNMSCGLDLNSGDTISIYAKTDSLSWVSGGYNSTIKID